jgi:hypothetical protein
VAGVPGTWGDAVLKKTPIRIYMAIKRPLVLKRVLKKSTQLILPVDARDLRYHAVVRSLTRGNKFNSPHDSSHISLRRADTPDGRSRPARSVQRLSSVPG